MRLYAPHELRVIDELKDLDDRKDKLHTFLDSENFNNIVPDIAEQGRLTAQWYYMTKYSDILKERIANFVGVAE